MKNIEASVSAGLTQGKKEAEKKQQKKKGGNIFGRKMK